MGASQNSHSCSMAHPPANSAGPVLRAELTARHRRCLMLTAINSSDLS
jgi:hypothetical protein